MDLSRPNEGAAFRRLDFLGKQPTHAEQTDQMMQAMYEELFGNQKNLGKQIRTICIALGLKPQKFVEAFMDDIKQEVFFKNLMSEQQVFEEEKLKKDKENADNKAEKSG